MLFRSRPKADADAVRMLFLAQDVAPTDASVLRASRDVERVIAERPSLKNILMGAGRPAGDFLPSSLNGRWFFRRPPGDREGEQ